MIARLLVREAVMFDLVEIRKSESGSLFFTERARSVKTRSHEHYVYLMLAMISSYLSA